MEWQPIRNFGDDYEVSGAVTVLMLCGDRILEADMTSGMPISFTTGESAMFSYGPGEFTIGVTGPEPDSYEACTHYMLVHYPGAGE